MRRLFALVLITSLTMILVACSDEESLEDYPSREVEMIIPWSPGGGSDLEGRLVAEYSGDVLGQSVVVVNIPGVGGTIGLEELLQKEANGYNIGQLHDGHLVAHHSGVSDINYDDFLPIASMTATYQILAVSSELGVNTLEEFIEYGQENQIVFGGTVSGIPRVWTEQIANELGIDHKLVGYEGLGEAVQALAGNHVEAVIVDYPSAVEFVEAGHMKFIAIGTEERVENLPDVPTFIEKGYNITMGLNRGYVAPPDTDPEIIEILSKKFEEAANNEEFIAEVEKLGSSVNYMDSKKYKEYLDQQNQIIADTIANLE